MQIDNVESSTTIYKDSISILKMTEKLSSDVILNIKFVIRIIVLDRFILNS